MNHRSEVGRGECARGKGEGECERRTEKHARRTSEWTLHRPVTPEAPEDGPVKCQEERWR